MQLSPKKYIETKARTLPVYKCLITKDWKESRMANVILMRKHVNGHVTAGLYLVDLLCLGIKDTTWFFNMPEEEFMERLGNDPDSMLDEIDYNLAHNIIYAAHDFAMEFDIHPHHDFEITRCILEEDNDNIPLIDIEVGMEGKPFLVVDSPNQYPDALAKLKKNAGEGNYEYSVGFDSDDEGDDYGEDEGYNEEEDLFLDDIPVGGLHCTDVHRLVVADLQDEQKIVQRTPAEQVMIYAELLTRSLPGQLLEETKEESEVWDALWEEADNSAEIPNGMQEEQMEEYEQCISEIIEAGMQNIKEDGLMEEKYTEKVIEIISRHAQNPLLLARFYENGVVTQANAVRDTAREHAKKLMSGYPLVALSVSLGALIQEEPGTGFEKIYAAQYIRDAFPGYENYHNAELANFWLIKMWQCIEQNDIKSTVQYYHLLSSIASNAWLLPLVWEKYVHTLTSWLNKHTSLHNSHYVHNQ